MNNSVIKQVISQQPLVSICIPAYNAEKTIVSTLRSIITQTYQNLEIIIVDNASTDNTLDLVGEFTDPRMLIYKNSVNIGAERNFSRCIELAIGDYIALFHADDIYMPEMVERQVRAFQANPSIGAVFTTATYINEYNERIGESIFPDNLKGKNICNFEDIFIPLLRYNNFLMCPSAMVKSKLYKELSPFNYEKFGTSADLDMWLRILEKYPIAILEEKLLNYRISKTQGSYVLMYLLTEKSDFLKTIDYYLSVKSRELDIPGEILDSYEIKRKFDNFLRAVNHLIKNEPHEAKKLIKESLTLKVFSASMEYTEKIKYIIYCILGILLIILINLGLSAYCKKGLYWFSYGRK
jgi:glycosyltransferase involved in cell wall biosynthesis